MVKVNFKTSTSNQNTPTSSAKGVKLNFTKPVDTDSSGIPIDLSGAIQASRTLSPIRLDYSSYTKYTPANQIDISLDKVYLDEQRAQNQTAGQLIGNSAVQLGATILGGTITGTGAVVALPELIYEGIYSLIDEDHDIDWNSILKEGLSGALYQTGIGIEEGAREEFPIYQTQLVANSNSSFFDRLGDATYWASMAPTVGSAAASVIPVTGALRGLSSAGKILQGINSASKLGRTANKLGTVLTGRRAAQIEGTILGTHLDAIEEIARGYDDQFEYAKSLGFNDEEATRYASDYASNSYKNGLVANAATNFVEWSILTKGINKIVPDGTELSRSSNQAAKGFARQGRSFEVVSTEDILKSGKTAQGITKRALVKTTEAVKTSLAEGLEEMNMDFALSEGEHTAKQNIGLDVSSYGSSVASRFANFLSKNETFDSFLWGAIGGGVMYGGRNLVSNVIRGNATREQEINQYNATLDAIRNTVETLHNYNGDISIGIEENGEITDPAKNVLVPIFSTLARANAFEQGEILLNELANMTKDEIKSVYGELADNQSKKQIIEFLRAEYEVAKKQYQKNKGITYSAKWNNPIQINMFINDYLRDYYIRQRNIVETEYNRLNEEYNIAQKPIDTRLTEASARLFKLDTQLEQLDRDIAAQREVVNEYNKIINDKNINDKLEDYNKRITSIEERIVDTKSQLKNADKQLQHNSKQIKNIKRLVRGGLKGEVKDNYLKQLEELKQNNDRIVSSRNNLINDLASLQEALIGYNESKSIIESDRNIRKVSAEQANKQIASLEQQRALVNQNKSSIRENNPEEYNTYNNIKSLKTEGDAIQPKQLTDLQNVLSTIDYAIAKYSNIENDKQTIVKEQEAAFDKLEEQALKQQKEREEQEREAAEQVKQQEDTARDIKDIENAEEVVTTGENPYSINKNQEVTSFTHNNITYKVRDPIVHNDKPQTIEEIVMNNNGELLVKLNGEEDYVRINELNQHNLSPQVITNLHKIMSNVTDDIFKRGFEQGLDIIEKLLNSKSFKSAFNTHTYGLQIITDRLNTIKELNDLIKKYTPEDITDELRKRKEVITKRLSKVQSNNQTLYNNAQLYKYFKTHFNINLVTYDAVINNDFQVNFVDPFINSLVNYVSLFADIINGSIKYKKIGGYEVFVAGVTDIINQFKTTLNNEFYSKYSLETFDDLKETIDAGLNNILDSLANEYSAYVSEMFKMFYATNKTYLDNIHNVLNNKSKNKTETDLLLKINYQEAIPIIEKVNNSLLQFAETGKVPTQTELESFVIPEDFVNAITNKNSEAYKSFTQDDLTAIRRLGLNPLIYTFNSTLDFFNTYRKINSQEGVQESNILHSINTLLVLYNEDTSLQAENIDYRNIKYTLQDVEYYLSDAERVAYKALEDIINRFTELQIYVPNHKITFEDILSVLYQQPNGRELVEDNYRNLYYVINSTLDTNRIEQIKNLIKSNIERESTYQPFFNILEDIQTRIANPRNTVNPRYIQPDGNLTKDFITYFEKNYTPVQWASDTRNGVVLPNNKIFNAIRKAIDPRTKIADSKVTIDGQEFTIEELVEAEQSLSIGQELNSRIVDDGQRIELYININGKDLMVGEIRIDNGYTYHGMPLTRRTSFDTEDYVFDSWIGNKSRLSEDVEIIISNVVRNGKIFDAVKNFVLEYERQRSLNKLNDDKVIAKLEALLEDVNKAGFRKETDTSPVYNAIMHAITYNTNTEDIQGIELDKVYNVLNPIFYNIPREHVNDLLRNADKIKLRYNSLRNRLIANFEYTDKIRKAYQDNPNSQIVITSIDKPSYSFASSNNVRNNISDNIPTSVHQGDTEAVEIITTQDIGVGEKDANNPTKVYSSVTTNSRVTDQGLLDQLKRKQGGTQFYAVVKAHDGENGKSLIPLRRTSARFEFNDELPYGKAALFNITESINEIISNRFLTNLSIQPSETKFQATQEFKDRTNARFKAVLDDLSESIIIDNQTENSLQLPWFDVSQLYKNTTRSGDMYFAKDITFIANDLIGNKYFGKRSYGYKIRIIYEYNTIENTPSKISRIEISRVSTKQGRVPETTVVDKKGTKVQAIAWSKGLTRGQIKNLQQSGFEVNEDRATNVSINMRGKDIRDLLNTTALQSIFGNMVRSVNMTDHDGSKTYDSRANGASFGQSFNTSNAINRPYTSVALERLKMTGKYNGKTEFATLQDFYIETGALTTGIVGTKTKDGKVISITNYNDRQPNIYVDLKQTDSNIKIEDASTLAKVDKAQMFLKSYSDEANNSFDRMIKDGNLNKDTLISFGIIDETTSDEYADELIKFFRDTFENKESVNLLFIDNHEDAIKYVGNMTKEEYNSRRGEFIPSKNTIVLYNNIFTEYSNPIEILGRTLMHETLHYRVINDLRNKRINKKAISDINGIIKYLNSEEAKNQLNDSDAAALNKYLEAINKAGDNAYTELISYAFTEPSLADILNKIQANKEISEERVSLWNRIIDIILDLLGISNVKEGSTLQQLRNSIVNNISLKAGGRRIETRQFRPSPFPTGVSVSQATVTQEPSSAPNIVTKVIRKLSTNKSEATETLIKDDTQFDIFEDITEGGIPVEEDINPDDLMALDVNGERLIDSPVGKGMDEIDASSLISPNDLLSLSTETSSIAQYKEQFIDKDGLRIC